MSARQRPVSLGRRLMPAVALASAGAGMIALLDQPTSALSANGAAGASGLSTQLQTLSPTGVSSGAAPGALPTTTTTPGSKSRSTGSGTATTTVPASPSCSGAATVGPAIDNEFGSVQVEAVLDANGKVCAVQAVRTPTGGKSTRINQRAVPALNARALATGSASFDMVSGATITSEGYQTSLQAILDGR